MKNKFIVLAILMSFFILSPKAHAGGADDNHVGFFFYGSLGFLNLANDTNLRTTPPTEFGSDVELSYGFGFGYNFTDEIAIEIQTVYATATDVVPNGETAREHAVSIRAEGKYSFLTNSNFNTSRKLKLYPYLKAGGVAHGLYINASNTVDKVGSWGYGFTFGGGVELNYGILFAALDLNNDFLYLQEETSEIGGIDVVITDGGFDYQISGMLALGVHF